MKIICLVQILSGDAGVAKRAGFRIIFWNAKLKVLQTMDEKSCGLVPAKVQILLPASYCYAIGIIIGFELRSEFRRKRNLVLVAGGTELAGGSVFKSFSPHFSICAKSYPHFSICAKSYPHILICAKSYPHILICAQVCQHFLSWKRSML